MERFLKSDCHRLMKLMWKSNTRAYIWLKENYGEDVHFSSIDPVKLREVHELLIKRAQRKGYYLTVLNTK